MVPLSCPGILGSTKLPSEIVKQGGAAWARLKKKGGNWEDWKTVGYALLEGRATAMLNAGAIRPAGRGYSAAFSDWLRYNGFDMGPWDRANLLTVMGILPEIERWRTTLSLMQRLRADSGARHPVDSAMG
jgi:hypothetical protein